ncbi:alpha/beta hydrolase [Noviherbaspirillum sp. 17J57-3]|uniref:Alpha/beta hydrolase n=2 Tax=Noviherbaspirillum galbum TaxID=2709383 RepID=A0A6B3SPT9_9BURK|nr:alpha/beta hydrolase [Noviherbaspirillum galbum]
MQTARTTLDQIGAKAVNDEDIAPPSWLLLALEGGRAPWELWASVLTLPVLRKAPQGDGHPVLVFPGLATGDFTTLFLRQFLRDRGYEAYAWEQGLNRGPRPGVIEACHERVKELHARHDRKVSLIGWSLGGIYAREIAKSLPEHVRVVVTLGTPFAGSPKLTNAWRLFELASGMQIDANPDLIASLRESPPVPTTSILSRTDGVVAWQACLERETERSENVEVHASHIGMGLNPTALYAIADRLAQPEGAWQRFDREGLQGMKRLLYMDPHRSSLFRW